MSVFNDRVLRRWVHASVYLLSSCVSFYGMVYGTRNGFRPPLITTMLFVIVGLFLAAVWQMLQGVRESGRPR